MRRRCRKVLGVHPDSWKDLEAEYLLEGPAKELREGPAEELQGEPVELGIYRAGGERQ